MREREQYSDKSEQQAAIHAEALNRAHHRNVGDGEFNREKMRQAEHAGAVVSHDNERSAVGGEVEPVKQQQDYNIGHSAAESAPALPVQEAQLNWGGGNLFTSPSHAPTGDLPGVGGPVKPDGDFRGGLSGVDEICGFTGGGHE